MKDRACLIFLGELDILLVVEVNLGALGTVDDVGSRLAVQHDLVMIAIIVREKHSFALSVVGGNQALCVTEIVGRESGDWTSNGKGLGNHGDSMF